MADFQLGQLAEARQVATAIAQKQNTGELHNLLGQIDEKEGKFVEAANDYEAAAHLDPSEDNLFDWGSEMLLHRTYEPAIAIFQAGDSAISEVAAAVHRSGLGAVFARQSMTMRCRRF